MEVLFKEIDCDNTKIKEQLGDNGQITDLNLMQFFGGLGLPRHAVCALYVHFSLNFLKFSAVFFPPDLSRVRIPC